MSIQAVFCEGFLPEIGERGGRIPLVVQGRAARRVFNDVECLVGIGLREILGEPELGTEAPVRPVGRIVRDPAHARLDGNEVRRQIPFVGFGVIRIAGIEDQHIFETRLILRQLFRRQTVHHAVPDHVALPCHDDDFRFLRRRRGIGLFRDIQRHFPRERRLSLSLLVHDLHRAGRFMYLDR